MKSFSISALIGLLVLVASHGVWGQTISFNEMPGNFGYGPTFGDDDPTPEPDEPSESEMAKGFLFTVSGKPEAAVLGDTDDGDGTGCITANSLSYGEITKWTIRRADDNPFQFKGIYLRNAESGGSTSGTITAIDTSGNPIGSSVNVDFDGTYNTSFVSNEDFWVVKEIWIEALDINFYLDEFTYGPPFSVADEDPAEVLGISLLGSPTSTATTVSYSVVFSKPATNVDVSAFELTKGGSADGNIASISGTSANYTVVVNGISGEGNIRLDLKAGTDIQNSDGTDGTAAFTGGQVHYVGSCFTETFDQGETDDALIFSGNGKTFTLEGNWTVNTESPNNGLGGSAFNLKNDGTGPYTITSNELITVRGLYLYVSSHADGSLPTVNGSVTFRGLRSGNQEYTFTKSSGFETEVDDENNNGYTYINFSSEETSDYSDVLIDRLEITLGGSFTYLNLDNFEWCLDFAPPSGYTVAIDQDPITVDNQTAVSFTFAGAETGATYNYTFSSDGGGTDVTGSGTIATATDQVTGIDLSGLNAGTVTLSVTLTDASGNEGAAATLTAKKVDNNAPNDITLTPYPVSINQSASANTVVGTLASTDADDGDTHTYSLIAGIGDDDNAGFNISGTILRATDPSTLFSGLNSVRIQTTDNNGGTCQKAFTITVVDDVAPTVNSVNVPANATYVAGQHLDFTVNVSEDVTVTGTPSLLFTIGSTSVNATYTSGSTTSALTFRYTVQTGDIDTDGIAVSGTSIVLNEGTINDGVGLPLALILNNVGVTTGILVDAVAPSVTNVDVPAADTYGIGESLSFTINFDEAVTVTDGGGGPRVPLTIGTATRYAEYLSGSTSSALVFSYTVATGDFDANGITVGSAVELNGSTLQDAVGNAATLTLNGVGITSAVLVDGVAPTVSTYSPTNGASDILPSADLSLTFSEGIALGTGNIVIYDAISTPVATIDVGSHGGQLSITDDVLTVNPTADLLELTDYYVHVGNDAIHDMAGNAYVGINNNTTWAFTVADVTAPSGYTVSIDQAEITLANHQATSFTFIGAELGATFAYEITSSGGGTPVTGNGTITAAGQQVSNIDVSGLANGTLTLSVALTDASGNVGTPATDNVTKAVNYPPVITTSGGTTSFTESVSGGPVPVPIDDATTISDPDNTTLASATVAITGNFQSGEDVLAFVGGGSTGNIDGSYNPGAGVLILTSPGATATLAHWEAALGAVTYSNTSLTPNTSNRTISFVVNDGLDDSTPGIKTVAVQAVNNPPVVTNLDGDDVTFIENGAAVLIDAGGDATVSDPDSPDLDGGNLTVTIVTNGVTGEDIVGIRNEGMAAGQIGVIGGDVHYGGTQIGLLTGGTGGVDLIVTFLPTVTPAAAQALIRNLTYSNSNTTAPTLDPRTIRVTLNDGDGAISEGNDITVNISAINDPPMVTTSGGPATFTESTDGDPVPVEIDVNLTVADPDNGRLTDATVYITSGFEGDQDLLAFENDGSTMGNIGGSYDDATGLLTLTSTSPTATLAEWEAALRSVTYSNSSQNPSTATRTVTFIINDGADASSPATKDINVVAVNTAPTAVDDNVSVTEDIPVTGDVLSNDQDPEGDALTTSVATEPTNGVLTLNADGSFIYTPNANYNGSDSFEYEVCDDGTPIRCGNAWVYLTIEPVNDAPTIAAPATIEADEDVQTPLTGISFSDVDAGNANVTVTFSVASGTLSATSDSGVTVGGSETGVLTLVGAIADINAFIMANNLTFMTALNATADVTLTIDIDDGGNTGIDPGNSGTDDSESATTTVALVVTAINDAPVNTVPADQEIDQDELLVFSTGNGNAISISDADAGGGAIRLTLTANNGLMTLGGITGLTFISGSGAGDGTMTLEGSIADINTALSGLTFAPTSGYNGAASLQIVTDDLGLTGLGGNQTDTDIITITVNPINPKITTVNASSTDGLYKIEDIITLTVTFDQAVTVDETSGSPTLLLETGNTDQHAVYVSGSGSNMLAFNYTVQPGDESADLDYQSTAALTINGATIQNASGHNAILTLPAVGGANSIAGQHDIGIDGIAPAINSVAVPADGYYREGEVLTFTVHVDDAIAVNTGSGTPYLELTIGTATVEALYAAGPNTDELAFTYTVQPGNLDMDGVALGNTIVLGGSTLRDAAGNNMLTALNNVGAMAGVLINTTHPGVTIATGSGSTVNSPFTATATFSEAVTGFALDDITVANATLSDLQTNDNISYGFLVTPLAGGTVELSVAADIAINIAGNGNSVSTVLSVQFNEIVMGITLEDGSFVYDGAAHSLEITGDLPDGTSVSYANNSRTVVGTQEVTATVTGDNYEDLVLTADLSITPATITGITLEDGSFVYDGTAQSLEITGTLPDGTTVAYTGNSRTDVGTQEVTATIGGDNYDDLVLTADLTVTPATITGITLEDGSFVYDGAAQSLEITGTLPDGTSVSYADNSRTDAGTQEVTATVTGDNYEDLVLTADLTVTPATITGITLEDGNFVYDGTTKSLEITGDLPDGTSVSYANNSRIDAGTQEVTATVTGDNYEDLVLTADLSITPATITGITLEHGSFVYDGTAQSLEITGTLPDGTSVSYADNSRTDAGTQEVTATVSGDNYEDLVLTADLSITPATITGITLEDGSFVYDGTAKSLEITGDLPDGTSVSYANNSRTYAGTQEVTATVTGDNYEDLVLTADLTVIPGTRTITFPELPEKFYGSADFRAGATASSGEPVTYTSSDPSVVEATAGGLLRITGAGTATITATVPENGNYTSRPQAVRQVTVHKATQSIAFNAPAEVNRDAGTIQLDVSASSGLPISLSIDDEEVATLEGTALNILRLGTVRITAMQAGDANHEPAEPSTITVRVTDPTLDLPIRIHKAVSPNGDGINEYLIVEAIKDYPENRVRIFNRNGTVVWEASGYNNSTVAFRGIGTGQQRVPAGTYFYIAEIRVDGEWKYEKGWFVLRY